MYVFRSGAARAAFGSGNDFFRQNDKNFIQITILVEKYTFVQKLARGGSGVLYGPIWMQNAILRSGTGRGGLNHSVPQHHQYSNEGTYIPSFSEFNSRGAELLVFTMPELVF